MKNTLKQRGMIIRKNAKTPLCGKYKSGVTVSRALPTSIIRIQFLFLAMAPGMNAASAIGAVSWHGHWDLMGRMLM